MAVGLDYERIMGLISGAGRSLGHQHLIALAIGHTATAALIVALGADADCAEVQLLLSEPVAELT